jgi:SAM-dependent methyltransferase
MDIGSGDGTLDKALLEDSPDIAMYLSELLPIGGEVTRQLNDLFPGRVHMAPRMDTEEVLLTAPMDVILCCEVIEHVTDPGALLRNMARNLALDGQIYVTTPDCAAWVERKVLDELGKDDTWYHHVRAYSPASLAREAIAAGFTPTVFRDQGGSLIMTASLTRDFRSAETHEMEPPAVMACLSAREQLPPPGSVIRSKVRLVESAGLSVDVLDGVILETL